MIISIEPEKSTDKFQHLFMIITLNKLRIDGNFWSPIKGICEKLITNIILNGKRLETSPLGSGTRQGCLFSPLVSSIELEVLAMSVRWENKIIGIWIERKK